MIITETEVTLSRATWEELRSDEYYREIIEAIEDREALLIAKESSEYFVDLEDYHSSRIKQENV